MDLGKDHPAEVTPETGKRAPIPRKIPFFPLSLDVK